MENTIELLKGFDLHTILSIFAIGWFFNNRQEKKIAELKSELKEINGKLNDLVRRLCNSML